MGDEQILTELRRAADATARDHHLGPGAAAAAWSAAHPSRRPSRHRLAVAAGVVGALAAATSLAVWNTNENHAAGPAGGSACAGTVRTTALPVWARAGFSPAGQRTPHVLGDQGRIVAVLFGDLRVHQPSGTHNKVLWVARVGYGPLRIRAQLEGTSRTVTTTLPDGPGPSYVDMPAAGCWRMSLTWSDRHDSVALRYLP